MLVRILPSLYPPHVIQLWELAVGKRERAVGAAADRWGQQRACGTRMHCGWSSHHKRQPFRVGVHGWHMTQQYRNAPSKTYTSRAENTTRRRQRDCQHDHSEKKIFCYCWSCLKRQAFLRNSHKIVRRKKKGVCCATFRSGD